MDIARPGKYTLNTLIFRTFVDAVFHLIQGHSRNRALSAVLFVMLLASIGGELYALKLYSANQELQSMGLNQRWLRSCKAPPIPLAATHCE